jgi:hypothetical protein
MGLVVRFLYTLFFDKIQGIKNSGPPTQCSAKKEDRPGKSENSEWEPEFSGSSGQGDKTPFCSPLGVTGTGEKSP